MPLTQEKQARPQRLLQVAQPAVLVLPKEESLTTSRPTEASAERGPEHKAIVVTVVACGTPAFALHRREKKKVAACGVRVVDVPRSNTQQHDANEQQAARRNAGVMTIDHHSIAHV